MSESVARVLLLTSELSFRGSSLLTLRLAQGLAAKGVETVLVCTRTHSLDPSLSQNVRIITVPGFTVPVWGRVVRRTVLKNLADQPPDVIHVHGPRMLAQGMWLGRTLNRPVVLTVTDQAEAARVSLPPQSDICRAVLCISESVRVALPHRLEQMEQRVVLPGVPLDLSGVDIPILEEGRVPVIGMAGPLEVIKGGSFFLRACHRVLDAGVPIRIVVTGSGPEERNLRHLATSLELDDHVTFVDDGTAMAAYLTAIDIFCMPSLQQGFGIMILEAMAQGRPVIASGVGGILSIIHDNVNGLIVPPSDSRALAQRLLELLRNPELARKIAVAGQNLVEDRFTLDRMVAETLALYEDVTRTDRGSVDSIPMIVNGGGS